MVKRALKPLMALLVILSLVSCSLTSFKVQPARSVSAATTTAVAPPTPEHPQSDAGVYFDFFIVKWVWNLGIVDQPNDMTVVQNASSTFTVSINAINQNYWVPFSNPNKIKSVTTHEAILNGAGGYTWQNATGASTTPNYTEPISSSNVSLPGNMSIGTHYFQTTITYGNGTIRYSRVYKIIVVPKPIPATGIVAAPDPGTIFWGESTQLTATLNPENSTSPVSWQSSLGDAPFSRTTGAQVGFKPTAKDSATDAGLKNDGTAVTVTASANGHTAQVPVNVGGLVPQTWQEGSSQQYTPPAADKINTAGATPSYSWTLYDENYNQIKWPAGITSNQKTLSIKSVPKSMNRQHIQLTVTWSISGNTINRYSNMATVTVLPTYTRLFAVPNLRFVKADGNLPGVADFAGTTPVTLQLQPKSNNQANPKASDGNASNAIAVDGPHWNLSVAITPFSEISSQQPFGGSVETATGAFRFQLNGRAIPIVGNGTSQALLTDQAGPLQTVLDGQTQLTMPNSTVKKGTYQAVATWTVTVPAQ